jgi:hypothetical protein
MCPDEEGTETEVFAGHGVPLDVNECAPTKRGLKPNWAPYVAAIVSS